MPKYFVISWDYKAQPDWVEIQDALNNFAHPQLTVVEHTGDDQHVLIVSDWHVPQEVALKWYEIYQTEGL